jgi:NAD-dependent epimerase/dehydratase family protein
MFTMTKTRNGLIGYTGFVGSNLVRQQEFSETYNSKNIYEIRNKTFNILICAGVSAVKWLADKEPERDWAGIKALLSQLDTVSADRFVLISTVDVYPHPIGVTEDDEPNIDLCQPYGRHRLMFERWATKKFENVSIVRLPGLFGAGLKKNIIYDLINGNQVERISPNRVYQWYPVSRLWRDISIILKAELSLINIATEPVVTSDIVTRFFPAAKVGPLESAAPKYDSRTKFATLLGGAGDYHMNRSEVFQEMANYLGRRS